MCIPETGVENFRLLCVDVLPDSLAFLAEPCEGSLSSRGVAADEGDVVGVGEGRKKNCRVSGAASRGEHEAISLVDAPVQDVIHRY